MCTQTAYMELRASMGMEEMRGVKTNTENIFLLVYTHQKLPAASEKVPLSTFLLCFDTYNLLGKKLKDKH